MSTQKDQTPATTENAGLQGYNYIENYADIKEVMEENLAGERLSMSSLDRIKVPGAGATAWEVETLNGVEHKPELRGVVVYERKTRTYWEKSFDETGGGEDPDCSSEDGMHGIGAPGGDCDLCPLGQFDPITNERPKCRDGRQLYLLSQGSILPVVLNVPPSSLKNYTTFKARLASAGVPLSSAEIIISLEKALGGVKKSIPYAKCVFRMGNRATPQQKTLLKEQSESMKALLGSRRTPEQLAPGNANAALPEGGKAQKLESDTGI